MSLDKRNKFVVKTEPSGKKRLFIWTPTLAQKEGHRTITHKEALEVEAEILGVAEAKRFGRFMPEIEEDNPVVEQLLSEQGEGDDPEVLVAKNNLKLAKSNDDLLQEELLKISKYNSKDQLEEYFLLKYRVELLPEKLTEMKKEAAQILSKFANEGKLYEVKR